MNIILGVALAIGCILGGFVHMGCSLSILLAPAEYIVLLGSAFGAMIAANPLYVLLDIGKAFMESLFNKTPRQKHYLEVLGTLYELMREIRSKPAAEIEKHVETPNNSTIFKKYPYVLKNKALLTFICDYCRLIMMGNARSFEVESLMDEEIQVLEHDAQKPYYALQNIADTLPALGIVAAVLGIIRALSNINVNPAILGGFIGSALVGTLAGVFIAYGIIGPLAAHIKAVRDQQLRVFIAVKQTLLAYMNGSMPQIALEYGRKTIPEKYRPTNAMVEKR